MFDVERHEVLADLDEDEQMRRIEAMRADIEKGNRLAQASEELFQVSIAEAEEDEQEGAGEGGAIE